jgi:hypothetical protein
LFSPGTPVSSTNKTDCHNITEILLKVALNTKSIKKIYKILLMMRNILVLCQFLFTFFLFFLGGEEDTVQLTKPELWKHKLEKLISLLF